MPGRKPAPGEEHQMRIYQQAELSDRELDTVSGGSFITQMAAAGVQGAATGSGSRFQTAPRPTTKTGRCSSNHNGVHY